MSDSQNDQAIKMRGELMSLRRNLQTMLEYQTLMAEVRWHCYHECIKVGFTAEQALELAKKP